jgi:hypothetical protein
MTFKLTRQFKVVLDGNNITLYLYILLSYNMSTEHAWLIAFDVHNKHTIPLVSYYGIIYHNKKVSYIKNSESYW